jgi:hypothetical protein
VRTTLDIEDDILQAAKELARQQGETTGQIISALARRGLSAPLTARKSPPTTRNGVPLLPSRGEVITLEHIQKLRDEEGI